MSLNYKLVSVLTLLLSDWLVVPLPAQNRFTVSIQLPHAIQLSRVRIAYDNGLSIVAIRPIFNKRVTTISGLYYSPYAEVVITYPSKTLGDSVGANFFLTNKKATITLVTVPGDSNPLRSYKTTHVITPADIGETDFKQFIAVEQTDFTRFLLANRSQMSDSLVRIAFAKSDKLAQKKVEYLRQHTQTYYAFRLLRKEIIYSPDLSADSSFKLFNLFRPHLRESAEGQQIVKIIRGLHLGKNNPVPDIVAKDASGRPVSLKYYRGKYILLNFWASWCGPCLAEMPTIRAIQKRYSSNDLVTVFITQDTDLMAWAKAVKKYQLKGEQLFSTSALVQIYGAAIPKVFVIDPGGQVIYSRDEEGDNKLEKLAVILSEKLQKVQ